MTVYLGLFLVAFLAATLVPAQSEATLLALAATGNYPVGTLLAFASAGNIAGSTLNWALGRYALNFQDRRWFPVKANQLEKLQGTYKRFGRWSLLASWVPIIGDPLTAIAGVLREPLWSFLLIVAVAKIGRYLAILGLLQLLWPT
jgi:membrane protein YqaA with SNARE-associated domain